MSMPTCGEEGRGEGEGVTLEDLVVSAGVLSLPRALTISLCEVVTVTGDWPVAQPT